MNRYLAIMNIWWQRGFTYRLSIFAYRVGEVFEMLVLILMWSRIFENQNVISGYTKEEVITYVLLGNLFSVIIRSFARDRISGDIYKGQLSSYLVKPMSYLTYVWIRDLGRAAFPTIFSILTGATVIFFFRDIVVLPTDPWLWLILIGMLLLAFVTEQLIGILIGFIAFWTDDTDAIYEVVARLKRFFSGAFFPIALLPTLFVTISFYLPFAYTFFVPAQLFLGKMTNAEAAHGLLIQLAWIIILQLLVMFVFRKGLRKYEGIGI